MGPQVPLVRSMLDCTGANAKRVSGLIGKPAMVAVYVTGTPDIKWSPAEREVFSSSLQVTIDQGSEGSPVPWAVVRDCETGAWTPDTAVSKEGWSPARPTVYCNMNTLTKVLDKGWKGDLWLAIPGKKPTTPPVIPGCNVVAVQWSYMNLYDLSVVFDPDWPAKRKEDSPMIHNTVIHGTGDFVPFPAGSFSRIVLYRDFLQDNVTATIRVAIHSASGGYKVHTVTLSNPVPVTISFDHPDTDAVSVLQVSGPLGIGYTID